MKRQPLRKSSGSRTKGYPLTLLIAHLLELPTSEKKRRNRGGRRTSRWPCGPGCSPFPPNRPDSLSRHACALGLTHTHTRARAREDENPSDPSWPHDPLLAPFVSGDRHRGLWGLTRDWEGRVGRRKRSLRHQVSETSKSDVLVRAFIRLELGLQKG